MKNLLISFGSRARGDSDSYSDIDLLEVLSTETSPCELESTLVMSRDHVLEASNSGSLFIKHVFSEGRLISGDISDYATLTQSWRPALSYAAEINENRDLLELLAYVPNNQTGLCAALDITICALRSVLIRSLAEKEEYVFSWSDLSARAQLSGFISPSGPALIETSRKAKNLYRSGKPVVISHSFICLLLEAARPALGQIDFQLADTLAWDFPGRFPTRSYKQLRAMELVRAARPGDSSTERWSQWIKNPRSFCAKDGY